MFEIVCVMSNFFQDWELPLFVKNASRSNKIILPTNALKSLQLLFANT